MLGWEGLVGLRQFIGLKYNYGRVFMSNYISIMLFWLLHEWNVNVSAPHPVREVSLTHIARTAIKGLDYGLKKVLLPTPREFCRRSLSKRAVFSASNERRLQFVSGGITL